MDWACPGSAGLPIGAEFYFSWVLRGRPDCESEQLEEAFARQTQQSERMYRGAGSGRGRSWSGGARVGLWEQTVLTIGSH